MSSTSITDVHDPPRSPPPSADRLSSQSESLSGKLNALASILGEYEETGTLDSAGQPKSSDLSKYDDGEPLLIKQLGSLRDMDSFEIKQCASLRKSERQVPEEVSSSSHPELSHPEVNGERSAMTQFDDEPNTTERDVGPPNDEDGINDSDTTLSAEHTESLSYVQSAPAVVVSTPLESTLKDELESSPSAIKSTVSYNHWKYVCIGIFGGIVTVYLVILALKVLDVVGSKPSLISQFDSADSATQHSFVNHLVSHHQDLLQATENGKSETALSVDDSDVFSKINPAYQGDSEVRELMSGQLHQSFAGLAYAPKNVLVPKCGVTQRDIILDLARMSMVTNRIRTYGTQCNQAEMVLKGIQELGINMTVTLGVWISDDDYTNWHQMDDMIHALKTYPRELIDGVIVGNEVLFRADKTADQLIGYINQTREFANSIGFHDLPIGTSELASLIQPKVVDACDFVGANIHPFFAGVEAKQAVNWTISYYEKELKKLNAHSDKIVITEFGWPYQGGSYLDATASPANMQQVLNDWVCNDLSYVNGSFVFEAFDEPWKEEFNEEGKGWETEWGFFNSSRQLKPGITIPKCS